MTQKQAIVIERVRGTDILWETPPGTVSLKIDEEYPVNDSDILKIHQEGFSTWGIGGENVSEEYFRSQNEKGKENKQIVSVTLRVDDIPLSLCVMDIPRRSQDVESVVNSVADGITDNISVEENLDSHEKEQLNTLLGERVLNFRQKMLNHIRKFADKELGGDIDALNIIAVKDLVVDQDAKNKLKNIILESEDPASKMLQICRDLQITFPKDTSEYSPYTFLNNIINDLQDPIVLAGDMKSITSEFLLFLTVSFPLVVANNIAIENRFNKAGSKLIENTLIPFMTVDKQFSEGGGLRKGSMYHLLTGLTNPVFKVAAILSRRFNGYNENEIRKLFIWSRKTSHESLGISPEYLSIDSIKSGKHIIGGVLYFPGIFKLSRLRLFKELVKGKVGIVLSKDPVKGRISEQSAQTVIEA